MKRWLLAMVGLAFFLRIVGLAAHPAGFTPDEASFGYDAYSLLQTGRDQWGNSWPLVLKSFGDGKLPIYAYLAMPSVAIFGLNEFAVRFPNAAVGTLAVLCIYLVTYQATKNKKTSLIAAFLTTVSPWHIQMSRGAFEANLTTFFLPLALYFYLKATKNSKYLILAALLAGINIFTYHSARLVTPVLFGILILLDFKHLKKDKWFWVSGLISLVVVILVLLSFTQGGGSRLVSSSIFGLAANDQRYITVLAGAPDLVSRIFYNRAFYLPAIFIRNYLSYFSPQFLFANGPAEATYGMIPGKALLYLPEMLFLAGFVYLLAQQKVKNTKWLLIWILLAPIPAALTIGPGSAANRAEIMMPALAISGAIGASLLNKKLFTASIVLVIIGLCFVTYSYWYIQPKVAENSMVEGVREVFVSLKQYPTSHVILSRSISEPQIYAAFYDPIKPTLFQHATGYWKLDNIDWVDQQGNYFVGRYTIKSIDKIADFKDLNTLVVGRLDEIPPNAKVIKTIYSQSGNPLWAIAQKNYEE